MVVSFLKVSSLKTALLGFYKCFLWMLFAVCLSAFGGAMPFVIVYLISKCLVARICVLPVLLVPI